MPRVFLVQNPSRRDPVSGEWVPKYDLTPAESFGEIIEMIPPGPDERDVRRISECLAKHLCGRRGYGEHDYLLALGDPVAIGLAMHLALSCAGAVRLLKYDRNVRIYRPIEIPGLVAA